MDDNREGRRDEKGYWKPLARIEYPPVFIWPIRPLAILKWLFGYPGHILPWNLLYAVIAFACWRFLTPPLETMKTFGTEWIALLFARNVALAVVFYGAFHLRLYTHRAQGQAYKYNARWHHDNSPRFLFGKQIRDNIAWTLGSGVAIWTAYEAVTLWTFANGYIPFVSWETHPAYCIMLMLLVPLYRELHFYAIHRLIHWPPLYRAVHRLHHKNVNPGPWSGLAMHPVEHLLYFSGVLIHWIVPSHPVHALFQLVHAGLSPAPGHAGFHKVAFGEIGLDTESYPHYLHHRYFECNYADGSIPIDRWMGTFHDGSDAAHQAMSRRIRARNVRRQSQTS
jgi:sterol desaturase/sphingolipid hydroxylase (fatty acid hydroxylase superfamily)